MSIAKACRLTPYPYGTPEWSSFENFAAEHYTRAINIATRAVFGFGQNWHQRQLQTFLSILDKTASPLVYLWEQWNLMPMETRLRWATEEYRKELEPKIAEAKRLGEEIAGQISSIPAAKPEKDGDSAKDG